MENISFKEAMKIALDNAFIKKETKVILLNDALGKILAEDIYAKKNLPSFDNSAMDGYAFKYEQKDKPLKIIKTIFAGDTSSPELKENQCYKIMTGAKIPSDADTVIPYEKCEIKNNIVKIKEEVKKGANFREKGEETKVGEILIKKGTLLEFSHIALLASQGITALRVVLPLKIAVISTGNEIKEPWEVANEDEIYNVNAFGITTLLNSFGFSGDYIGKIPDNFEKTKEFIASVKSYDVILTTGGISHGDADFIYDAFLENGLKPLFHGIRVKPGHPTMMGVMGKTFVMGLPGNPLTTMLITHSLAIPVLSKISGCDKYFHTSFEAKLSQDLKFRGKRLHIVLGNLENGYFIPTNGGKVGSGMTTPLTKSNAVAYFDEGVLEVKKEQNIKVILLNRNLKSDTFVLN